MSDKIDKQLSEFYNDLKFIKQAPLSCNSPTAVQDLFYDSARMLEAIRRVYKFCDDRRASYTDEGEYQMAKEILSIFEDELNAEVGDA